MPSKHTNRKEIKSASIKFYYNKMKCFTCLPPFFFYEIYTSLHEKEEIIFLDILHVYHSILLQTENMLSYFPCISKALYFFCPVTVPREALRDTIRKCTSIQSGTKEKSTEKEGTVLRCQLHAQLNTFCYIFCIEQVDLLFNVDLDNVLSNFKDRLFHLRVIYVF